MINITSDTYVYANILLQMCAYFLNDEIHKSQIYTHNKMQHLFSSITGYTLYSSKNHLLHTQTH